MPGPPRFSGNKGVYQLRDGRWMSFKWGRNDASPVEQEVLITGPAKEIPDSEKSSEMPPAQNTEKKEANENKKISLKEAQEAVNKLGLVTINHEVDPNNIAERELRTPTFVKPERFQIQPVSIQCVVESGYGAVVYLPCPRDYFDQHHLASFVIANTSDGKEFPLEATVVYGETGNGPSRYENPYLRIPLKNLTGQVTINANHWVLYPVYPKMGLHDMQQRIDPQTMFLAQQAFEFGNNIKFDPNNGMDCRGKAETLTSRGGGRIVTVEGYSDRVPEEDGSFGGTHFVNALGAGLEVDARGKNGFMGPQTGFLATGVGIPYRIKGIKEELYGSNYGYYQNCEPVQKATLRSPGPHIRMKIPPAVQTMSGLLEARRKEAYEHPKVVMP
jgi:hypothetical protein